MKCINCNNDHAEKFCPNCGEKARIKRITFSSIINSAFSTVTNMDKGFLYNLKNLTLSPQQTITDYLKGKRKGIFNPISFLIVSVTIYLIIDASLKVSGTSTHDPNMIYNVGYQVGYFIKGYLKYFWILNIFWMSTATRLLFRKYNFAEHLAINSFILGQATLASLIGLVFFNWFLIFDPIIYLVIFAMTYQVFKGKNENAETLFKSFLSILLFVIQIAVILVMIGVVLSQ